MCGSIIVESDFDKESKIHLLEHVKYENDEYQLKNFILEDIFIYRIDSEKKQKMENIFNKTKKDIIESYEYSQALVTSADLWESEFRKCSKSKCKKLSGKDKKICNYECRIYAYNKSLTYLQKKISSCKDAPSPEKCIKRFNKRMNNMKKYVQEYKLKILKQQKK